MRLSLLCLVLALIINIARASDSVEQITDANPDNLPVGGVSKKFSFVFKSYDSPRELSAAVLRAVDTSIKEGRLPILVSDIDETLLRRTPGKIAATNFYNYLKESGAISKAHGVLALTARLMTYEGIVRITNSDLSICVPEFFSTMRSFKNLDGLIALGGFQQEKNFLHDSGLLIMGEGGLSKHKALDKFLKRILVDSGCQYDIIFVDNEECWFPEFCTETGYDPKIIKGYFFHYDWEMGEDFESPTIPPLNVLLGNYTETVASPPLGRSRTAALFADAISGRESFKAVETVDATFCCC